MEPAWRQATIMIAGVPHLARVDGPHCAARSLLGQLWQWQKNMIRMHLDGVPLRPGYSVDAALTQSGLIDIAVHLQGEAVSVDLGPGGRGGSRVDRHHGTEEGAAAAAGDRIFKVGGDHDGTESRYDRRILAAAVPPGHRH